MLTWSGTQYTWAELPWFIFKTTGMFPSTAAVSLTSTQITSTSYVTLLDGSSGPYLLTGLRVDPDVGSGGITFKVTVDGSLIITASKIIPGDNHVVGQYFNDSSASPIAARTSLKVEAKRDSGTYPYAQMLYQRYTLA